jgi:N-acetyl-anhydromuramoyl-L-alanine amidase
VRLEAAAPLSLTEEGMLAGVRYIPSPNCDERPPREQIVLIVIHNISLPPGEFGGPGIIALFTNSLDHDAHPYYDGLREIEVSAHFLIRRDGEILQFVPCTRRAWHAGVSQWEGRCACNDFSIGIELEGADDVHFTDPQYDCLARLTRALRAAYPIRAAVGHSDIAPGRKSDPGQHFDWPRFLAAAGFAAPGA